MMTFEQAVVAIAGYMVANEQLTGSKEGPYLVPADDGSIEIRGTIIDKDGNHHTMREVYIDLETASKISIAMGIPIK